jgi:hypothetical protein
MRHNEHDPAQKINPKSIDPNTGELYDSNERPVGKRSKFLDPLRRAARDAVVRRTSTKR